MKQKTKIYEFDGKRYTTDYLPNAPHLFVEEKEGKAYLRTPLDIKTGNLLPPSQLTLVSLLPD